MDPLNNGILQHRKNQAIDLIELYAIEPTLAEKEFDDITHLASAICNKPIAFISILNEHDQYFKSIIGLKNEVIKRSDTICQYAVAGQELFEVEDTTKHTIIKNNPYVVNDPNLRFYAGMPLITHEGEALGAVCVADTTPGKLTDLQRESLKALSRLILNLLDMKRSRKELMTAKQKADDAVKAKSEFLSVMSHEIRTPLNGIIGITNLLIDESPQEHQLQYLKTLKFSSQNLMSIVNDILDFSKIESGKIAFEEIPFNLIELTSEVKNANAARAQDKNIRIKLKRDDDIPTNVIGDPVRLSQILNNLVNNAVKFTHTGEVIIDLQLEHETTNHVEIRFAVEDTGIGIPKEKQSALFERFTQVDSSINRRYGGTGLGLAITKRLLELQSSSIHLESEPGKGTKFYFTLVFAKSHAPQKLQPVQTDYSSLGFPEVLLVEDNEVNCLIAKKIMSKWDAKLTVAHNGLQAIQLLCEKTFDLILMDIQMPEMDGYETTRAVRTIGFTKEELPIIALSASALEEDRERAMDLGMNDFVSKPFNPTELHSKIKKQLKKKVI